MEWQIIRDKIYYKDGSYRDIYINNTTREDWQLWAEFVNDHYKTSFLIYETQAKTDKVDITKAFDYWNGNHDNCSTATVFVDGIQVNAHFFNENVIEQDITPTEINTIDDHNKLVAYMIRLSKVLDKEVVLTSENKPENVLISVDKDQVFLILE